MARRGVTPHSFAPGRSPAADEATTEADDGFDWGWLGLAGLAGLRRRQEPVRTTAAGTVR